MADGDCLEYVAREDLTKDMPFKQKPDWLKGGKYLKTWWVIF